MATSSAAAVEGITTHTHQEATFAQSPSAANVVNFNIGQPGPRLLSLPHFTQAFQAAFKDIHPTVLAYADPRGHRDFRNALATWLTKRYGFPVDAADLFETNGNTHGVDFVFRQLMHIHASRVAAAPAGAPRQCSYVVMDDPTYFLIGSVVQRITEVANFNGLSAQANAAEGEQPQSLLTLRMCTTNPDTGFDVDAFEKWLEVIYGRGQTLLGVYLIPVYHNPTGSSMSPASATRLVQLAHRYDFYIVSDEPYPFLTFTESADAISSLATVEHQVLAAGGADAGAPDSGYGRKRVVALGSFSKIFAPGLRLGWLHADPAFITNAIVPDPILDSGGGVNPVAGAVVRAMLEGCNVEPQPPHSLDNYLAALVPELAARNKALCTALRTTFGEDITFNAPRGGYFLWMRFNTTAPGFNGKAFRGFAKAYNVGFLQGSACRAASGAAPDEELALAVDFSRHIRLSFAFYETEELVEGVRRLRVAYDAFLASLAAAPAGGAAAE